MKVVSNNADLVILVDEDDNEVGTMPKLEAHQKGVLHRALSVFAFDEQGRWILQRRAFGKYHSEGLWSNTCCSHPYAQEPTDRAAIRRLNEEMGISGTPKKVFSFLYQAQLDHDLTEHELDHIFILNTKQTPNPNPTEVSEWRAATFEQLETEISQSPENFTEWFKMLYQKVQNFIVETSAVKK